MQVSVTSLVVALIWYIAKRFEDSKAMASNLGRYFRNARDKLIHTGRVIPKLYVLLIVNHCTVVTHANVLNRDELVICRNYISPQAMIPRRVLLITFFA